MTSPRDPIDGILAYHERTKHDLRRYARGPGQLDWATQPDPFRTYAGAPRVSLPLLADENATTYTELFVPQAVTPQPVDLKGVATLLELSLGLSAWKQFQGQRWALRCNPSSGNLHPTEGYLILADLPGLKGGVYHYVSRDHALERRSSFCDAAAREIAGQFSAGAFLVGLSSIHWREAWKYGERAFRYCQHDVGHAIAAVRFAAAALGWTAVLLENASDASIAEILGLHRSEDFSALDPQDREHPDVLLLVSPPPSPTVDLSRIASASRQSTWDGKPNALSPSHVRWAVIDDAAESTWKPATPHVEQRPLLPLPPLTVTPSQAAATVIRQRRSCLALDGATPIPATTFYNILDHLLPRPGVPPWDALPWTPHIHLGIFVHRVHGLAPGLYLLERSSDVHDSLRSAMRADFRWTKPASCPNHLRLFCLSERDFRDVSRIMSCHQEIAADGVFSLGMIADFGGSIRARSAWWYRRLFWEAGVLGQVLYLEAEAAGIRGTGIGCYFDDAFHELVGFKGDQFQDLYHFTMGGPVEDLRLMTLPPYAHLRTIASAAANFERAAGGTEISQ